MFYSAFVYDIQYFSIQFGQITKYLEVISNVGKTALCMNVVYINESISVGSYRSNETMHIAVRFTQDRQVNTHFNRSFNRLRISDTDTILSTPNYQTTTHVF